MSAFIIHLLIPILVVAALGLVRHRDAWAWSWAAWAGDIDYLGWVAHVRWEVPNVHRALFHNVWWLVLGLGLAVAIGRRWVGDGRGSWTAFVRERPGWALVPFFYASHLLLDVFQGGITPLWPVSHRSVFWDFELRFDTTKPIPTPQVQSEPGTYAGVPDVSEIYTWMNAEQFGIFLLYLLGLGLLFAYERAQRRFPPMLPPRRRGTRGLKTPATVAAAAPAVPPVEGGARRARRVRGRSP